MPFGRDTRNITLHRVSGSPTGMGFGWGGAGRNPEFAVMPLMPLQVTLALVIINSYTRGTANTKVKSTERNTTCK